MKLPYFPFYPGDWMKDPNLRRCSFASKGVLIDLLCLAFETEERGVLISGGVAWTDREIAHAIGGNMDSTLHLISELLTKGVLKKRPDGAIFSSRMVQDEKVRRVRSNYGKTGGNPALIENYNMPGFVYLFQRQSDMAVKIGVSVNPRKRLSKVRTQYRQQDVKMIGLMKSEDMGKSEKELHTYYSKFSIDGAGEWFMIPPDVLIPLKGKFDVPLNTILIYENEDETEVLSDQVETIYSKYPLKVGRPAALKAIQGAVSRGYDPMLLLKKTEAYAAKVNGTETLLPHPSTWFNQDRFNDDPSTWVRQHLNGDHANLEKKIEIKEARMKELKRRHFSEVQTIHGGTYLAPGWRDAKAKEEYLRLKSETETLNQQLSKA